MSRFRSAVVLAGLLWCVGVVAGLAARPEAAVAQERQAPAAKFEVYKDRGGEYRWRLRAQNRQILATSGEAYADKRGCLAAIESVKRAAAEAPVEEVPSDAQQQQR